MRNDDPVMKAIILLAASILSIILTLAGCVIAPGLGWLWLVMLVPLLAAGCQHDDRHLAEAADRFQDFKAIRSRHHNI